MQKLSCWLLPSQLVVYEKAQGYWVSRAIYVACEYSLADHLASGPKNISELARITQTHENSLYRLMRALSGEGVFRELPGRRFGNNRQSAMLMDGKDTVKYLILNQYNPNHQIFLSHLSETVRTGEGAGGKMFGKNIFRQMGGDPVKSEIYNKSMDQSSEMISLALLSSYDFSRIRRLVDVGGGRGVLLSNILRRYPHIQGVLFDLPHVTGPAQENFSRDGLSGRVSIVTGDFFEDIPRDADAYFMKNILHAYGDDDCVRLLTSLQQAMDRQGRLILLEAVVVPDNRPAFGKLFDLLMMTGTEGGKERTKEEFEMLFEASGLKIKRILRTVAPFSVIEAVKK